MRKKTFIIIAVILFLGILIISEKSIIAAAQEENPAGSENKDIHSAPQEKKTSGNAGKKDNSSDSSKKKPLVTNVFFETDLREALRDISAQTKVKIIPDESVQGIISIEMEEVPLEAALRMILVAGGYTFKKMPEGYYLVGSGKSTSSSFNLLTKTEYIKPNYISAEDISKLVSSFFEPYIQINKANNSLTITAPPEIIERFKKDVSKIDQPPRQIMIEALVVELSEEGKESLGITWGSMTEGGFSLYAPSNFDYDRSYTGESYSYSGTLTSDFLLKIHSLASEGKARIRANPRVATLEGKEAQFYVGKEEWYLINTGSGTQSYYTLQSIPTGVVLNITPYVAENKDITVYISPDVSEVVGKGATNLPVITKRTAKTVVRVRNGQTITIGGLIQEQTSEIITKVPFLGSLPMIGSLFRHKSSQTENREVVIFITPHLIDDKDTVTNNQKKTFIENNKKDKLQARRKELLRSIQKEECYSKIRKFIESTDYHSIGKKLGITEAKEVLVKFVVLFNGKVEGVEVLKPSGVSFLDSMACDLIEEISPFPPFPEEIQGEKIICTIPIKYLPR